MTMMNSHGQPEDHRILTDLPNEILSAVFSYLPTSTYYHVALASRRLREVVEPLLYHTVDSVRQKIDISDVLVRTLKARPDLRAHVNTLCIKALCVRDGIRMCPRDDELLALVPGLRELELNPPKHDLQVQHFVRLQTLRLRYGPEYYYYAQPNMSQACPISPLEIIARHFWMPSLRNLEIDSFNLCEDDLGNPFVAHEREESKSLHQTSSFPRTCNKTSPITTLRLTNCVDSGFGVLSDILLSVKRLERFTFGTERSLEWMHWHEPGISPAAMFCALEPHTSTLAELIITGDYATYFLGTPLFGTLTHYQSLKRLAIPEHFLASESHSTIHERLPAQLEDLQLQYPMGVCDGLDDMPAVRHARLRRLAVHKLGCLPRLGRLIWWYQQAASWSVKRPETGYGEDKTLTDLVDDLGAVGVQFEWMSSPYYSDTPFACSQRAKR